FGLHHTNISVESDNIRLKNGGLIADNQLNIKTKKLETTGDKTINLITEEKIKERFIGNSVENKKILGEDYYKSKLIGKNILLNAEDIKLKATDILAFENILLKSKNISIENDKIKTEKTINERGLFRYKTENGKLEESKASNIRAKNLFLDASKTIIKDSNITVNNLKTKGNVLVTTDVLENKIKLKEIGFIYIKKANVDIEKAKGSNIQVKGISEFENLSLISSKLQSKDLIVSGKLNVEAKVLKSKENSTTLGFKLIDDIQGHYTAIGTNDKGKKKLMRYDNDITNKVSNSSETEDLSAGGSLTFLSLKSNRKDNEYESNARAGLKVTNSAKINKIKVLSSDVVLNNADINEIESNTTKLNNKINENLFKIGIKATGNISLEGSNVSLGLDITEKETHLNEIIHENSNISLLGNSKIEKVAKFTSTNLKYGKLEIKAKDVLFNVNKDKKDSIITTKGGNLGINININSPILNNTIKIGRGVVNLFRKNKSLKGASDIANGFVGSINSLAGNLKAKDKNGEYRDATKSDLKEENVEKNLSGYISINGDVSQKQSTTVEINSEEEIKSGTLTGDKLIFNNNKEVKYISTVIKDTKIEYNNVGKVIKDVEVANNKKQIIHHSESLGLSSGFDLKNASLKEIGIDLSIKGSYDVQKEKFNKLNELTNVSETFNNVKDIKLKGVKSNKSTLSGTVKNLVLEDVKDEITRIKVGLGGDVLIPLAGTPGANGEFELITTRKEKVHTNDINLNNIKVENLTTKKLKEKNYDYQIFLRGGTSGARVKAKINDFEFDTDISMATINALRNIKKFREKIWLAKEELESTGKGIKDAIKNIGAKPDEKNTIGENERESILKLGETHLKTKHSKYTKYLNKAKAVTKDERQKLVTDFKFKKLFILDEPTLENIHKFPPEIQKRIREVWAEGQKITIATDSYGNVYTFGNLSELEFKKGLMKEYRIIKDGRYVVDPKTGEKKLLGATLGNIGAEYITEGNEEILNLEKDDISTLPKDAKIVSDNIITDAFYATCRAIRENLPVGFIVTDVYVSAKIIGKVVFQGAKATIGQGVVLTVSVIDGLDELNKKWTCGTIYGECDTALKNILGDNIYNGFKTTATVVGLTQIGKDVYSVLIKDGKIVEIGRKIKSPKELKKMLAGAKEAVKDKIGDITTGIKSGNLTKQLKNIGANFREVKTTLRTDGTTTRGFEIDTFLGNNLGEKFKTYDKFDPKTGVAVSIKSVHLDAKTNQSGNGIYNSLKKALRDMRDFDNYELKGIRLENENIKERVLEIAINNQKLNASQLNNFERVIKEAKKMGIKVKITILK
ncbi:endonuclease toxin domain-containing protein, partial [Oceanivirga salmonicida]|uniref:endonuclease toxin domain-containing protein n=1 Tax=Oceanivirga salmonicida TaxID=1769291 RepID=UPI0018CC1893